MIFGYLIINLVTVLLGFCWCGRYNMIQYSIYDILVFCKGLMIKPKAFF